eukprot:270176_1
MCTNDYSEKWMHLIAHPSNKTSNFVSLPTGTNANNYIAIDPYFSCFSSKINIKSIHKYNIDNDTWSTIDGCNDIQNISGFSAALHVKKQILFLFHKDSVRQIQLNNNNINNYTHNNTIYSPQTAKSIILNDSLFIIGGKSNNSILKWNLETKTLTKFSDMYNKMN